MTQVYQPPPEISQLRAVCAQLEKDGYTELAQAYGDRIKRVAEVQEVLAATTRAMRELPNGVYHNNSSYGAIESGEHFAIALIDLGWRHPGLPMIEVHEESVDD